MGMAAGQARLLSITARMSDNELRAQIINNNKLRLATDSSRASETYIQALNNAKLMISNYDENNNATYQELTFNALTAYNPYNNQYALSNASGNVLISEYDAKNYESVRKYTSTEDRLAAFLKCYGLENTTSYFIDTLPTACYSNADTDGNKYETNNVYLPLYDKITDGPLTDSEGYPLSWNTGLTVEQLQAMYNGAAVINVNGTDVSCKGYMNTLQTQAYFDYQYAYEDYVAKKEDFELYSAKFKDTYLNDLVKTSTGSAYSSMAAFIAGIEAIPVTDGSGNKIPASGSDAIQSRLGMLRNLISESSNKALDQTAYKNEYNNMINSGITVNKQEQVSSDAYCFGRGSDGKDYLVFKEDPSDPSTWDVYGQITNFSGNLTVTKMTETVHDPGTETEYCTYALSGGSENIAYSTNADGSTPQLTYIPVTGDLGGSLSLPMDDGSTLTLTLSSPEQSNVGFTFTKTRTLEEEKQEYLRILGSLKDNIRTEWNPIVFKGNPASSNDAEKLLAQKYDAYANAAVKLGNMMYGSGYTIISASRDIDVASGLPDVGSLDNFLESFYYKDEKTVAFCNGTVLIKEKTAADFDWNSVSDDFKQVLQVLILDAVMDTYGEPKYTYIDQNNPNENGDAKAQWYTNLFNRIEAGGYRTIKDGLASSPEWIKFAFESGIITLEQVDDKYAWNKMIYTSSADITEQTDSVAVAKAEAEYNAAMNKIENKDKRYDMELKNIDTEHNSLQTEYDSIKNAVSKNIERTFKLYS